MAYEPDADDTDKPKKKKGEEKDILVEAKDKFALCQEREDDNREAALDDLKFSRLDEHWPENIRKEREKQDRPCLTIPKLPAFIRQVVNDARQNKPAIKVHPADSFSDVQTAAIYDGLIRHIEVSSKAPIAYDTAADFAVTMGFGYFRINTKFADDDTFDLDLAIERVANPFSVWGDPYATGADSADWDCAFVTEMMPKKRFEELYRDAEQVDWEDAGYDDLDKAWRTDDEIRVAEYWHRENALKKILMLSTSQVVDADVYKKQKETYDALQIGVVNERQVQGKKVTQYIMTGAEVLQTNKWPGRYIPIIPVYGEEINVEGKRHFRSLIRGAKDAQRSFNYWRTTTTELVALAPKAPFIGPKGAFTTDQAKWDTANSETHSYIEFDGQVAPQRQQFAAVPAGALQEALNASDDVKAILGMYDASLGAKSNETSGKAIMARQREGDVSTFHFNDNLNRAIEHGGRVLIDLIPKVYTGPRVIRILGQERGEVETVQIAGPQEPGAPQQPPQQQEDPKTRIYDLGAGKYDLTVSAGPSFTTRRQETTEQMMELIRVYPDAAPIIGDLLAKNLDWPGADKVSERLQAMLPAQIQNGMNPEIQKAMEEGKQQIADLTTKLQQAEQKTMQAEQKATQAQYDRELEMLKQQNETKKHAVEMFKAETERMQVIAQANQPPAPAKPNGSASAAKQ